jgi:hypothetical protein
MTLSGPAAGRLPLRSNEDPYQEVGMSRTFPCALALVFSLGVAAHAADDAKKEAAGAKHTLTGCLQKGADATTFVLTNVSGGPKATNKEWQLTAPASLNLTNHVGHKVTVTGAVAGVGKAVKSSGEAPTSATMKEASDKRHLEVASMTHVAATCP